MGTTVETKKLQKEKKKEKKRHTAVENTLKKNYSKQSPSIMKLHLIHLKGNSSLLLTYRCVHTAVHTLTRIKSAII